MRLSFSLNGSFSTQVFIGHNAGKRASSYNMFWLETGGKFLSEELKLFRMKNGEESA